VTAPYIGRVTGDGSSGVGVWVRFPYPPEGWPQNAKLEEPPVPQDERRDRVG
jgi:hypothetical protein